MMVLDWPADDRTSGTECRGCGSSVSNSFARVFGDNDDRIHGCPTCTTFRELSEGGGMPEDGAGPSAATELDRSFS